MSDALRRFKSEISTRHGCHLGSAKFSAGFHRWIAAAQPRTEIWLFKRNQLRLLRRTHSEPAHEKQGFSSKNIRMACPAGLLAHRGRNNGQSSRIRPRRVRITNPCVGNCVSAANLAPPQLNRVDLRCQSAAWLPSAALDGTSTRYRSSWSQYA